MNNTYLFCLCLLALWKDMGRLVFRVIKLTSLTFHVSLVLYLENRFPLRDHETSRIHFSADISLIICIVNHPLWDRVNFSPLWPKKEHTVNRTQRNRQRCTEFWFPSMIGSEASHLVCRIQCWSCLFEQRLELRHCSWDSFEEWVKALKQKWNFGEK